VGPNGLNIPKSGPSTDSITEELPTCGSDALMRLASLFLLTADSHFFGFKEGGT